MLYSNTFIPNAVNKTIIMNVRPVPKVQKNPEVHKLCWIQESKQSNQEESKEGTSRLRKKNHERVHE